MSSVEKILKKNNIEYKFHSYKSDTDFKFADEVSDKLGVNLDKIFKTLIVSDIENNLYVGVLSSSKNLDLKKFAKLVGVKKIKMADKIIVEKSTGYKFGGISPIGQKKRLKTYIGFEAKDHETIFISSGNKCCEVEINPYDLLDIVDGKFCEISM